MKINYFEILKSTTKEDLFSMKAPLLLLVGFFVVAIFLFPKPSKIYKDYILKECSCFGFKAAPRATKGSFVGDEFCMGIPFKCTKLNLLKEEAE